MKRKEELYRTAQALVSCAHFEKGDFVSVKYYFTDEKGVNWYICNGKVAYPQNHLTRFCF